MVADFARSGVEVFAINYNSIAKRSFNGNASALFKDSHHPNDAGHRDIGTALLPLTIVPVLLYLPELGGISAVVLASLKT